MTTIQHLQNLYSHFHSKGYVYPNLANTITLTSGAGAWELGSITEIIPASMITDPFDLHFCVISSISAQDDFQINFYSGAALSEILIAQAAFSRSAALSEEGYFPLMCEIQDPNTRISAAIACSAGSGKTIEVKINYNLKLL